MTTQAIEQADKLFDAYAQTFEHIYIEAKFRTEFAKIHSQGEYALRVKCLENNPAYVAPDHPKYNASDPEPKYNMVSFDLSFKTFNGTPYAFATDAYQWAAYEVEKGSLAGLYSVSLVQDGNFLCDIVPSVGPNGETQWLAANSVIDHDNIFCKDIEIHWANKINLTDGMYLAWISMPLGNAVYDAGTGYTGMGEVTLNAHLYYGNTDILSKDTCEVMWFREKLDMTQAKVVDGDRDDHNKSWWDYAGNGWAPVSRFKNGANPYIDDGYAAGDAYVDDFDVLHVRKEGVPWQWKFKLVVVYNNMVFDATEIVYNLSSPYDLELQQFLSADKQRTYLRIINKKDTLL